jgi:hypothetical protein
MRYKDMEVYGPTTGIYRHAVTVRTKGYSMATTFAYSRIIAQYISFYNCFPKLLSWMIVD